MTESERRNGINIGVRLCSSEWRVDVDVRVVDRAESITDGLEGRRVGAVIATSP